MNNNVVNTGVNGLDRVLYGGIPRGNTVIVEGFPGTGKTLLGMQFLYQGAVQHDEPGIYITFEEFPDQIYKDMKAFGWDIRKLEEENKLRVITLSPEVLMDQMMKPDGLFEHLIHEIGCKRIVVDSISLFQYSYASIEEQRKVIYSFRNTLRKYQLTSILLKEMTSVEEENVSFINYLVDGVITLTLKPYSKNYRKRTLEVTKMRGSRIQEGEHLYRITDEGIYLIPALSMVEDEVITAPVDTVPTAIPAMDRILGGGIHDGATFTIDTNSKSNYRYIVTAIKSGRIKAGQKLLIFLSSLTTISELESNFKKYDLDLAQIVKEGNITFVEHYRRNVPKEYKDAIINVSDLDNEQYRRVMNEQIFSMIEQGVANGEKWFVYYDLNTIASQRGSEFVKLYFGVEVAKISSLGVSTLVFTNFKELGEETSGFVERSSNGVIRTWVDGNYQFLQITKTPNGTISEPLLVEKIDEKPFIRLV
ncbi:ATPase domain-containing protein [Salinibacillus xinjiangensis]|uniref:Circadian clock protein KaiC n=1 Tax=Salinibacillus xinjiangensis TaxID=1229268 RepID=A0A6G1X405_9BACI|nr:ATPase domain-containing protein [Salinibacillus xinjiangensis]MRG85721.1 circadian clock protein KaiC [Salinibacillus xinjiangensis]